MNNKTHLVFKYFQKKDLLTVKNREYQKTISTLFKWLIDNDKVQTDKTTKYLPDEDAKAIIITKQDGIIAGFEEIGYLLEKYTKLAFSPKTKDGSGIKNKETIAEIRGKSRDVLAYERTILNILARMSGIATETNRLINFINPQPFISATRKTPWMSLDKKAVAVAGGLTHRLSLSDGILVKDNHLISNTIESVLKTLLNKSKTGLIEIEVDSAPQAVSVIKIFKQLTTRNPQPVTINHQPPTTNNLAILLDNFTPSGVRSLLSNLGNLYDISKIIFEASGGITQENIREWSRTGVDIISLGSLTRSVRALDLSLEIIKS